MKIRTKIVVFVLIVSCLPLLVVSFFSFRSAKKALTERTMKQLNVVASLQKTMTENAIDRNRERISLLTSRTALRQQLDAYNREAGKHNKEAIETIIRDALESVRDFRAIYIMNPQGQVVVLCADHTIESELPDRDAFVFYPDGTGLSDIFHFSNHDSFFLAGSLNLDGRHVGSVIIEVDPSSFALPAAHMAGLGKTGEILLVSRGKQGEVMYLSARRHNSRNLSMTQGSDYESFSAADSAAEAALAGKEKEYSTLHDYRGEPVLCAVRRIEPQGWGIIAKIDTSEAYLFVRAMLLMAVTFTVMTMLFTAWGAYVYARSFSEPLIRLTRCVDTIRKEGLSIPVDPELTIAASEIGSLASAFDAMRKELKQAYENMAENVRGKTCELEEMLAQREAQNERLENTKKAMLNIVEDLEELKQIQEQHALFDSLTGLPNRRMIIQQLGQSLARIRRYKGRSFALLFLDIDLFKNVNDSLGHIAGDTLLVEVGKRLLEAVRGNDMVARLGGDEFTIYLDDIDDIGVVVHVAERIRMILRRPIDLEGQGIYISSSIGIVMSRTEYNSPEDILRDADTAMYRAKSSGKNRYEIFDDKMREQALKLLSLESEIRRAVRNNELRLYYQPVVSVKTGLITGVEALLRWEHMERGFLPPDTFIPAAEETGSVVYFTEWVVREAVNQAAQWHKSGYPLRMAVNLSVKQVHQKALPELVQSCIDKAGFDPHYLEFEITETTAVTDYEFTITRLRKLTERGELIAIDDFGTGYASLAYLNKFPVDAIKIDCAFISGIPHNRDMMAIVEAILVMAHTLKIHVIAEGVETEAQLRFLQKIGCDEAQGYLFSRPVPVHELTALLSKEGPIWF